MLKSETFDFNKNDKSDSLKERIKDLENQISDLKTTKKEKTTKNKIMDLIKTFAYAGLGLAKQTNDKMKINLMS